MLTVTFQAFVLSLCFFIRRHYIILTIKTESAILNGNDPASGGVKSEEKNMETYIDLFITIYLWPCVATLVVLVLFNFVILRMFGNHWITGPIFGVVAGYALLSTFEFIPTMIVMANLLIAIIIYGLIIYRPFALTQHRQQLGKKIKKKTLAFALTCSFLIYGFGMFVITHVTMNFPAS